jgi:hypothetical protein
VFSPTATSHAKLLILACMEVENACARYMREARAAPVNSRNYTTNDYVKLLAPLLPE